MRYLSALLMLVMLLCAISVQADEPKAKLAVPAKTEQQATYNSIKELFKDGLEDVTATLVEDFLKTADASEEPAEKYVIYRLAIEVSPEVGDPMLYMKVVEAIEDRFTGGEELWAKGFNTRKIPKDKAGETHEVYGKLIELCVQKNRFDLAMSLARAGGSYIRVRDRSLNKEAVDRMKLIRAAEAEYKKVEPALKTLATNPKDLLANTIVGKYKCFVLCDWPAGLKHLTMGDDEELKSLAGAELLEPASAEHQAGLADNWVKVAEKEKAYAEAIKKHAAWWYQKALPELTGIQALKARRFLESIKPEEKKERNKLVWQMEKRGWSGSRKNNHIHDVKLTRGKYVLEVAMSGSASGNATDSQGDIYLEAEGKKQVIRQWTNEDQLPVSREHNVHTTPVDAKKGKLIKVPFELEKSGEYKLVFMYTRGRHAVIIERAKLTKK